MISQLAKASVASAYPRLALLPSMPSFFFALRGLNGTAHSPAAHALHFSSTSSFSSSSSAVRRRPMQIAPMTVEEHALAHAMHMAHDGARQEEGMIRKAPRRYSPSSSSLGKKERAGASAPAQTLKTTTSAAAPNARSEGPTVAPASSLPPPSSHEPEPAPSSLSSPSSSPPSPDSVTSFSPEQQRAIDLVVEGKKRLLLTGPGGTGKSAVIREIKRRLEAKGRRVVLTATTGVAAVNIGGVTLHSFLRLAAHATPTDVLRRASAFAYGSRYDLIRSLSCMIIDEVSMMRPDMLAAADIVLRAARKDNRPFGGLQVVLAGDFFQLPPVIDAGYRNALRTEGKPLRTFVFESRLFYELIDDVVDLNVSFRHADPKLAALLSRVRLGRGAMTSEDDAVLLSRVHAELPVGDGIIPTRMYSRNVRVAAENASELALLAGEPQVFDAEIATEPDLKLVRVLAAQRALKRACKKFGLNTDAAAEAISLAEVWAGVGEEGKGSRGTVERAEAGGEGEMREGAAVPPLANDLVPQYLSPVTREMRVLQDALFKLGGKPLVKTEAEASKKLLELFSSQMRFKMGIRSGAAAPGAASTPEGDAAAAEAAQGSSAGLGQGKKGAKSGVAAVAAAVPAPSEEDSLLLHVKEGAQVMLTYNLDLSLGLVNGSRGVVAGFRSLAADHGGQHGSGSVDGGGGFLFSPPSAPKKSRARTSRSKTAVPSSLPSSPLSTEMLPYVKFASALRPGEYVFRTVERVHKSVTEEGLGTVTISYVPLRLAWASTIHKSQGMSLDRVKLSMSSIFEHGQAYVGLSRARSLAGMSLDGLRLASITANPRVVDFYSRCIGARGGYEAHREAMLTTLKQEDEWPVYVVKRRGASWRTREARSEAADDAAALAAAERDE